MKIMFVCTGNICRSAMAEAIAKKIIKEKKLNIEVCSAGTYAITGEHASFNTIEVMKEYDVDVILHKSTSIQDSRIKEMDLVFCATQNHKNEILRNYNELTGKVFTMKEYAEMDNGGTDLNISDPWGYDMNTYRMCAAEICLCVEKILEKIVKEGR